MPDVRAILETGALVAALSELPPDTAPAVAGAVIRNHVGAVIAKQPERVDTLLGTLFVGTVQALKIAQADLLETIVKEKMQEHLPGIITGLREEIAAYEKLLEKHRAGQS